MATLISRSPEATEAFGSDLARRVSPGGVIGVSGPLGAGKTRLVQGLARGLGIQGPILSPTFALVREYRDGSLPLYHLDLYRLTSMEEILGAGMEAYLPSADGVSVVEWFERWSDPPPTTLWRILITPLAGDERRIDYELAGF